MKGLNKKDLPKVGTALVEGWFFVVVLIFLVVGLVYFRWGNVTPYYASALLFVLSFFNKNKEYRLTPKRLYRALGDIGKIITNTVAMILPFTFIIAGLVITGLAAAVSTQLVMLGGDHIILVLLLTILACYVLGIMGMDIAAYLFFSVSIAPAMVSMGLNKMAVHLFLTRNVQNSTVTFDNFAGKRQRDNAKFIDGHPCSALLECVAPLPEEMVIPKSYASAFYGTPLQSYLVTLGIDTVIIVGGSTGGCCRATAVDAATRSYRLICVEDCLFDRIEVSHKAALLDIWMKYGDVVDSAAVKEYFHTLTDGVVQ